MTLRARSPCLKAFWLAAALPSGVTGPVERWALARLASICFSDAMIWLPDSRVAGEASKTSGIHGGRAARGGYVAGREGVRGWRIYFVGAGTGGGGEIECTEDAMVALLGAQCLNGVDGCGTQGRQQTGDNRDEGKHCYDSGEPDWIEGGDSVEHLGDELCRDHECNCAGHKSNCQQ